jgi:hypothetical protein
VDVDGPPSGVAARGKPYDGCFFFLKKPYDGCLITSLRTCLAQLIMRFYNDQIKLK